MADAIVSYVAEQIVAILKEQISKEVNLVRGVDQKVLELSEELRTVRNVLEDAEKKRFKEKSVRDWLVRLEDASYEMEDVLDEWYTALLKLQTQQQSNVAPNNKSVRDWLVSLIQQQSNGTPSFISSLSFQKVVVRRQTAKKIENTNIKLEEVIRQWMALGYLGSDIGSGVTDDPSSWRVQSTSFVDMAEVHGRDIDRDVVASKILTATQDIDMEIVSIVGVGGVGKTTLAQLVFNDARVKDCFELKIWICVSDPFDEVGIAKKIVEGVTGKSSDSTQLQVLQHSIIDCISGKKFLLVLDDVWTEDSAKWEPLKNALKSCGGMGSKVLVTTRKEKVAKTLDTLENGIHRLGVLSDEACWSLLQRIALYGRSKEDCAQYKDIGMEIVGKCKGLPLAAKTLGSLLRSKNGLEEWENVLRSETWELNEVIEVELFPHLLLSYNELSPSLKRCFSYCAVFPKDSEIEVEEVIRLWMALGYLGSDIGSGGGDMELRGRQYVNNLAMRSLFQDFEKDKDGEQIKFFKLHDIVHDFAQYLRKNGVEAGSLETICSELYNLQTLLLSNCNLQQIPRGIGNLINLRHLDLSENASLKELPREIGNLINLRHLILSDNESLKELPREIGNLDSNESLEDYNESLKELPESICGLRELQTLNIDGCTCITSLPQWIHRLVNLKHLHTDSIKQFPQGLAHLTCLRTLSEFRVGKNVGRLGWLKNLNRLSGSLTLRISLNGSLENTYVEDAQEGELRHKEYLQELDIIFLYDSDGVEDCVRINVIDALQPHPNLQKLRISCFEGSRLPGWISSPINQVKYICLRSFDHLLSLPPLGILPCLEEIEISSIPKIRFLGREFLGITTTTEYFPKLKKLKLEYCSNWEEWEDITDQQEDEKVSFMPHLTSLTIWSCNRLAALPHRLLRKAAALKELNIYDSIQLEQHYGDKEGSPWKSISNINPRIHLRMQIFYIILLSAISKIILFCFVILFLTNFSI
ncbi:putative disease resistance protein rga4 [Phtheirospermum japonicum]|uniref:Putative disease resistance protein rga4 n=1 Tax=Phtheirospermum japonicum TaxID=374723 RepID=A0A830CJ20_9LAMI|nr:putative disease resistance protein rga4 [Phtheirospermum japonicum]